jgi:hypothetical protein
VTVKFDNLQKAFALAHHAQANPDHSPQSRAIFRAIAHQIWISAGQDSNNPPGIEGGVLREGPTHPPISLWRPRYGGSKNQVGIIVKCPTCDWWGGLTTSLRCPKCHADLTPWEPLVVREAT